MLQKKRFHFTISSTVVHMWSVTHSSSLPTERRTHAARHNGRILASNSAAVYHSIHHPERQSQSSSPQLMGYWRGFECISWASELKREGNQLRLLDRLNSQLMRSVLSGPRYQKYTPLHVVTNDMSRDSVQQQSLLLTLSRRAKARHCNSNCDTDWIMSS